MGEDSLLVLKATQRE